MRRALSILFARAPLTVLALALGAAPLVGCGGPPERGRTLSRAEADAVRQRARQATDGDVEMGGAGPVAVAPAPADPTDDGGEPLPEAPPEATTLPEAPPGHLAGDGFGPGQREAVLDARKAVSEQIVASMKAETDTRSAEYNGEGDQSTSVKVRTTTAFDHVELIKTIGVVRRGPADFVARAALDRDAAIAVYAAEIARGRKELATLIPSVTRAIETGDTSVLLRSDRSPSWVLAEQQRRARIINALGGSAPALAPPGVEAIRGPARAARSRASIRLQVKGATPGLRRGVLGQVSKLLAARGCTVVEGPAGLAAGGPTAQAVLTVSHRAHRERELDWVYVGYELDIRDAGNGRGVFHHASLPTAAHGGGINPQAAEDSALRALSKKLPAKDGPAYRALTCR